MTKLQLCLLPLVVAGAACRTEIGADSGEIRDRASSDADAPVDAASAGDSAVDAGDSAPQPDIDGGGLEPGWTTDCLGMSRDGCYDEELGCLRTSGGQPEVSRMRGMQVCRCLYWPLMTYAPGAGYVSRCQGMLDAPCARSDAGVISCVGDLICSTSSVLLEDGGARSYKCGVHCDAGVVVQCATWTGTCCTRSSSVAAVCSGHAGLAPPLCPYPLVRADHCAEAGGPCP